MRVQNWSEVKMPTFQVVRALPKRSSGTTDSRSAPVPIAILMHHADLPQPHIAIACSPAPRPSPHPQPRTVCLSPTAPYLASHHSPLALWRGSSEAWIRHLFPKACLSWRQRPDLFVDDLGGVELLRLRCFRSYDGKESGSWSLKLNNGGSVWASLPPLKNGSTEHQKPLILAIASQDSASFFRDRSLGSDSPISAIVTDEDDMESIANRFLSADMDLQKQIIEKSPPKRRLTVDTIF
ncbi:unnamed protein product [Miscanthus lutarioriparius]|uniref:Uncharacterized protein n=1 Tax=Miscanthus lutarioriparius TaxID=422564 RepID=A0A811Q7M1_9POAL|nr:unnamed protein product [Miscanthus lutarioriparius]